MAGGFLQKLFGGNGSIGKCHSQGERHYKHSTGVKHSSVEHSYKKHTHALNPPSDPPQYIRSGGQGPNIFQLLR